MTMSMNDQSKQDKRIEAFRAALKNANLTVNKLADLAGFSPNTIYAFFSKRSTDLSYSTWEKSAKILNISVAQLMGEVSANGTCTPESYIGFAEDGQEWYEPQDMTLGAENDLPDMPAGGFIVKVPDDALKHEGLQKGRFCWCESERPLKTGDLVYLETKDGKAAIRKLISMQLDAITLQWQAPDGTALHETLNTSFIKRMAPVVMQIMRV